MRKLKKAIAVLLVAMFLFQLSVQAVCACANGRSVDTTTGWTFGFPTNYTHAGTKTMTYYYSDTYGTEYHTRFTQAKALWGSYISLSRTTDPYSANIVYRVDESFSSSISHTYAVAQYMNGGTPPMHATNWYIAVNKEKYDPLNNTKEKIVLAHEIGHTYGLGHVGSTSQIMYSAEPLTTMAVTAKDTRGMQLMTHAHSCSSLSSSNTYERVDTTLHKKRCKTCMSFVYEPHTDILVCTLCQGG